MPEKRGFTTRELIAQGIVKRTTLYKMVREGTFPRPIRVNRTNIWLTEEIDHWVNERKAAREVQL